MPAYDDVNMALIGWQWPVYVSMFFFLNTQRLEDK